jgi:hypothetical protein
LVVGNDVWNGDDRGIGGDATDDSHCLHEADDMCSQ